MTKIKFKFHQKPLSDEQINSFKNFDSLMTAFEAAPKPSLQYQLIHNRFFIYTTGIMSGIMITTIVATLFFNQNASDKNQLVATNISQIENKTPVQSDNGNKSNINSVSANKNDDENLPSDNKEKSLMNAGFSSSNPSETNSVSANKNDDENLPSDNKEKAKLNKGFSSNNPAVTKISNSKVSIQSENLIMNEGNVQLVSADSPKYVFDWQPSTDTAHISDNKTEQVILQPKVVPYEDIEGQPATLSIDSSIKTFTWQVPKGVVQSDNENSAADDTSRKKLSDVTAQVENKVVDISKNITDESKNSYMWMRTKLNGVFASKYHDKRQKTHDTITIENRAAQVSFLYPIGSNGTIAGRYSNVFSFNILSGYNGGVNGFELGGLVNIDRKNMNGLQIGGLTNVVFGNANGLQIGGLVNHARNLNGAQIGGLVNTSLGTMKGTQIGGLINYTLDSINGVQIGGIANISTTSKNINGFQIGGIANLSLGKMNGSQISGIVNVANKLNGFQIGLINVGVKVAGMQIGLINISDSLKGVPIGLISISRNGLFHVDVFNTDFSNINASVRLGSNAFYNIFSIGVSPGTADGNRYSFGYGIGSHIKMSKKFFTNIDALAWNVHYNNFNDWSSGINLVNQLRILPGWQFAKGIGVYAGPCINVEVLDDSYNSVVKSHLFNAHGGGTTGVNGWIGWTAGLQFF